MRTKTELAAAIILVLTAGCASSGHYETTVDPYGDTTGDVVYVTDTVISPNGMDTTFTTRTADSDTVPVLFKTTTRRSKKVPRDRNFYTGDTIGPESATGAANGVTTTDGTKRNPGVYKPRKK